MGKLVKKRRILPGFHRVFGAAIGGNLSLFRGNRFQILDDGPALVVAQQSADNSFPARPRLKGMALVRIADKLGVKQKLPRFA